MTNSQKLGDLAAKHDRITEERFTAVRQWVEYMKEQSPEVWDLQQNAGVDSQLESAQQTGLSADHERQVQDIAQQLADEEWGYGSLYWLARRIPRPTVVGDEADNS